MKKSLYLGSIPLDFEAAKDTNPANAGVMGATVYSTELMKALLRYSSYDEFILPVCARHIVGDFRDNPLFVDNLARITLLPEHQNDWLKGAEHLVFSAWGIDFSDLARIRNTIGLHSAPCVGVTHSLNNARQLPLLLLLLVSGLRSFDSIICTSRAGERSLLKLFETTEERLRRFGMAAARFPIQTPVIPLGVEVSEFSADGRRAMRETLQIEDGIVFLYVGRFSSNSKADLYSLLVGFKLLLARHNASRLILAGDDTDARMGKSLTDTAYELDIGHRVLIIPNPSHEMKLNLYACSDVFVSLVDNIQETFGITLLEAMAAGLPVIASDWSGYREIVEHNQTGFLIPTLLPTFPYNFDNYRGTGAMDTSNLLASSTVVDLRSFLEHALELARDARRRAAFGEAGRRRALAFYDWSVIVSRYEELWAQLVAAARATETECEGASLDLSNYHYRDIFSHFATSLVAPNTTVRISSWGTELPNYPHLLSHLGSPETWFRKEVFVEILTYLEQRDAASVSELVGSTVQNVISLSDAAALSHICRLWKYGVLVDEPRASVGPFQGA